MSWYKYNDLWFVHVVGSAFIVDAVSGTSAWGMYKCGGVCWVSMDICVAAQMPE